MGKIKQNLIELEDKGIITWSEEFDHYYLTSGSPSIQFKLEGSYVCHKSDIKERSCTTNPIFAMPYGK